MLEEMTTVQQTYYVIALSEKKSNWTPELWEKYFTWFYDAFTYKGGHSYVGFLNHARKTALENVPSDEYDFYNNMSGDSLITSSGQDLLTDRPNAEGPGRHWSVDKAMEVIEKDSTQRDILTVNDMQP